MPRAAMSVATMKATSPRFTLRHHPLALLLRQVAVEQLGVEAVAVEHRGHQRGVVAGVAEDDGVVRLLHLQHVDEVARLRVRVGHVVADVVDVLDREDVAGQQQRLRRWWCSAR